MTEPNVLLLGGSDSGKTHYAGQLLGRLRYHREGRLTLRPGGVEDMSKLEEVLGCLEEGRAAGHTPAETWTGIKLEMAAQDGSRVILEWPEYAGEKLATLVEQRQVSTEWRSSIEQSAHWILFVRPSTLHMYEDALERPTDMSSRASSAETATLSGRGWDDRARYVELLQVLLFANGHSTLRKASTPRLAVLLSCWDELNYTGTPEQFLTARLPLLNAFIRSSWTDSSWSVWGLSSLGRALRHDKRDPEFAARGPENFGYVIPPGNTAEISDLTAPVAWLLGV